MPTLAPSYNSPVPRIVGTNAEAFDAEDQLRTNIKELMRLWRINQVALADRVHQTQPWLSKRLTGKVRFKIEDLGPLACAFGLSPAELLRPGYGKWNRRVRDRRSGVDRRKNTR